MKGKAIEFDYFDYQVDLVYFLGTLLLVVQAGFDAKVEVD